MIDQRPSPSPVASTVCDVCQDRQAFVTIGAVDYCARCAPPWHPSLLPLDDDELADTVAPLERDLADTAL